MDRHTACARYVPRIRDCPNFMSHQGIDAVPYELHFGRLPRDRIIDMFPMLEYDVPSQDIHIQLVQKNVQPALSRQSEGQKGASKISLAIKDLILLRVSHLSDASQSVSTNFSIFLRGLIKYRI